jgi:hypothetical protein
MQMTWNQIRMLIALGAVSTFFFASRQVRATTYYSTSAASGDFEDQALWENATTTTTNNGYPGYNGGTSDVARIGGGASLSIDGAAESDDVADIQIGYDSQQIYTGYYTDTLNLGGGSLGLSGSGYVAVGYIGGSTAVVDQTAGTLNLGTGILYLGASDTSQGTLTTNGTYNFSGGVITAGSTSKTYVGFLSNGVPGDGTFSVSGNAVGSSISVNYLYLNYSSGSGASPSSTLQFAIGSTGVTAINCARLYWGSVAPDLDISLLSAPPSGTISLVTTSTTGGGAAGTFGNLGAGGTVSATLAGVGTYTWNVITNGGAVDRDVDLTNEQFTPDTPEPVATGLFGFAVLALFQRPARQERRAAVAV